jgi:hypothetical protein
MHYRNPQSKAAAFVRLAAKSILLLVGITQTAGASPATAPRGSFLTRPAISVADLLKRLDDPLVRARYSRLFHLSPEMVRLAFGKMHLTRMPAARNFQVWYVHPGEQIGYKLRRVRKGTLIFAMPDGTPALVRLCGNPLRATLPNTATLNAFLRKPPTAQSSDVPDFDMNEEEQSLTRGSLASRPVPRSTAPPQDFVLSSEPLPPGILPSTPVSPGPEIQTEIATHHVTNWLNNLTLLAPVAALVWGGSDSQPLSPGSGPGTGTGNGPRPVPGMGPWQLVTPEGSSLSLLLGGGAGVGILLLFSSRVSGERRRRKKRPAPRQLEPHL